MSGYAPEQPEVRFSTITYLLFFHTVYKLMYLKESTIMSNCNAMPDCGRNCNAAPSPCAEPASCANPAPCAKPVQTPCMKPTPCAEPMPSPCRKPAPCAEPMPSPCRKPEPCVGQHQNPMRSNPMPVRPVMPKPCCIKTDPLENMPLAMAYIPWQCFSEVYDVDKALMYGTIFPELNKPFYGKGGCQR